MWTSLEIEVGELRWSSEGRGDRWRSRSENIVGHLKGVDETDVRLNADRHLYEIMTAGQPDRRPQRTLGIRNPAGFGSPVK